jgi:hypothetical protein
MTLLVWYRCGKRNNKNWLSDTLQGLWWSSLQVRFCPPPFKKSWTRPVKIAWAQRAVCQNDALHLHESERDVFVRSWPLNQWITAFAATVHPNNPFYGRNIGCNVCVHRTNCMSSKMDSLELEIYCHAYSIVRICFCLSTFQT